MASVSGMKQAKVTDYYRKTRPRRSPSPKRAKQSEPRRSLFHSEPRQERSVNPHTPTTVSKVVRITEIHPVVPSLELPPTYSLLLNWFASADQLVALMYNRQELITFMKLQSGVQKTTRRNFGLKQLGQIKTVYPEAYEYEQIRMTRQAGILQNRHADYELTIKPNLLTDLSAYGMQTPIKSPRKRIDVTPTKTPPRTPVKRPYFALSPTRTPPKVRATVDFLDSPASPSKNVVVSGAIKPFTGGRLVSRNQVFRRNLFGILRQRHKEFLGSLTPPIVLNEDEDRRLTSWHPEFLLNEQTLLVPVDALPVPPVVEKVASARDLLTVSANGLNPKVKEAVASVAEQQEAVTEKEPKIAQKPAALIKGIPPKLLEKIREKERQKKQLAMLRVPEEETRRLRLSRLPDFVRIINMYFATEGKSVLPSAQVQKKLTDSYATPMTAGEIVEHLKLLRDLAPDWISQTEIAEKGSYLRVNRDYDVGQILKTLEKQQ